MRFQKRVALVIGNSLYDDPYYKNLVNPTNEADAMGAVLQELKCTVIIKKNLTYADYGGAFDEFIREIATQKADVAIGLEVWKSAVWR